MAKTPKYPIHPDFAKLPYFPLPFNRMILALINGILIKRDVYSREKKRMAKAITHQVISADGYAVPVLQFNPDDARPDEKLPAILYFHGGGFVITYAALHVAAVDIYAQRGHCRVFLVDYRLAPAHPFPKGFEDCYAALPWLVKNAGHLGVDASRIAVMGDSAGGALAAGVAQRALDEKGPALCGQVLIYPVVDKTGSSPSAAQFLDTPLWNGKSNRKMWQVYLKNYAGKNTPAYAAPDDRQDLHGLPTAYVETAEFDPLRDEGLAYAHRLEAAGVKVSLHQTQGTVHGYDYVFKSEITQQSFEQRVKFLKTIFLSN